MSERFPGLKFGPSPPWLLVMFFAEVFLTLCSLYILKCSVNLHAKHEDGR